MILYEEILREFQKKEIKYILVGGIAFNLLGSFRSTADLDILVEMSDDNLKKVVTILKKKGYRVKQPIDPMGLADKETREEWIRGKHMKAFNFYKDKEGKEVDIVIKSPISYKEARQKYVRVKSGNLILPVISIDNLIKMKENTGRNNDIYDVRVLKKIREIKRRKKKK